MKASKKQGRDLGLKDVEPAAEPVEGRALIADLEQALSRYVIFPEGGGLIVALWAIMTHLVDRLELMPRLLFTSPTRSCGKTRALDVLSYLVSRPVKVASISPSALFRVIEAWNPTVLFDEMDQAGLNADEAGEIRRLLNAGHSRATASAIRAVGKDFEPRRFAVFCPMALAGIGRLPDVIESRCVRISMKRRGPGERVARMREKILTQEFEPLRRRIARWARDRGPQIELAEPAVPDDLEDRDAENAEPLLAIADELGVGTEARRALLRLRGGAEAAEEHAGLMMLGDLRAALKERRGEITSHGFRELLVEMEERPWATWRRGQQITAHGVGRLLAPFGVTTRNLRIDGRQAKGYALDPLVEDAFRRYLPSPIGGRAYKPSQDAPVADETVGALEETAKVGRSISSVPRLVSDASVPASESHETRDGTVGTAESHVGSGYGAPRPVCCGVGMTRASATEQWTCRICGRVTP